MWYSAKILYKSQIDGDSSVEPRLSEESIIVIDAENDKEAEKKAVEHAKEAEQQYKNLQGENVDWKFVMILEIQDLCEEEIYSGMEVYSKIMNR